ncbi:MAG: Type-1 restriction enzyme MjaXIP specificity protein [Candidatus Methanogaster sp.]|nr:MAG: Type-1 restriction enzyme MjaXIP specificity protein [ANME-2 cluster archaeon]
MGTTTVEVSSNFKMTEKCLWPEDWDVVILEDVCVKAINGGTPSTEVEKYWGGDIPWITGADILNQKVSKIRRYITEEAVRNSSTNVIPKGNLLVVTRTGVGKLAIAPFDVAVSQDFTGIIPTETIKAEFLFWLLNNSANYFLDLTQGTSINGITRKDLMRFVFPLPPLPEQHQIADILSTVDWAIEQTEAIIAKQQRTKTGLMQDLLTRGIDEHGNIRSEETHEFKDSPLGRIPVEWEVKPLGAIIEVVDCKHYTPSYVEEGIPVIRPRNIKDSGFDFSGLDFVTERDYALLTDKHEPIDGDIVFSRNASFGVPVYVERIGRFCIGQDVVVMKKKSVNTRFILFTFQSVPVGS